MKKQPWEDFTLGELRGVINSIPTSFDKTRVYLVSKEGTQDVLSVGLSSKKGRVDYDKPKGDEVFYITPYRSKEGR
jgi:hypothetical protein